tara:strand:+ start:206 stop:1339 length:1134 start_codon:yes stop_codon:yes gene_type:complete
MQDGVVFLTLNDQPKPLDGKEFVSQNWWMGMASRPMADGTFMVRGMLSLEPLTVGGNGYGELFQTGETYREQPLVNRQHPHDFVMQLTAAWRRPLSPRTSITFAGGPVGEATLGPVAFMHRLSAAENPFAPLGHHTFDSTHIVKGVIAARLDHGPIAIEGSVFHGGESDEDRWGISDVGTLDSWATRVWFLPDEHWAFQASHGFLRTPERLEPGNVRRTTASVSWLSESDARFTALTAGYGHNDKDLTHSFSDAFFVEATRRFSPYVVYSRFEAVDVETELLLKTKTHIDNGHAEPSTVGALTIGTMRDLPHLRRFELAIGGDVTIHKVPDQLVTIYGARPVSFKIFFRLRPPVSPMGRMRNGTMMQPMMQPMREHQ